jgi:hypothetical protein
MVLNCGAPLDLFNQLGSGRPEKNSSYEKDYFLSYLNYEIWDK